MNSYTSSLCNLTSFQSKLGIYISSKEDIATLIRIRLVGLFWV